MNQKRETGKKIEEIRRLCTDKWDMIPHSMYNDIVRGTSRYWSGKYSEADELLNPALNMARSLFGKDKK